MKYIAISILFGLSIGCANIYSPAANKATYQAMKEDAQKANDGGQFSTAITDLTTMQTQFPNEYVADYSTNQLLLASAYAGQCGFNFASFFTTISGSSPGSTPVLKWLMNNWTTAATVKASCTLAETTMKTIYPTFVGRPADQSLFLVLLEFAKIGVYLREIADTNRDGLADNPPFDGGLSSFCSSANMSDADVAEVGAALGIIVTNMANAGSLGSFSAGMFTGVCATLPAPVQATCNAVLQIEDEAQFLLPANSGYLKVIRSILNTNNIGVVAVAGTPCP
jgi:hypothetical protein